MNQLQSSDKSSNLPILTRLSNLESENLELNQQVGELGRALGQEAAAYQAQVGMVTQVHAAPDNNIREGFKNPSHGIRP